MDGFVQAVEEEGAVERDAKGAQFDWVHQWYPLAVAQDLDAGRPHAEQLLGGSPHYVA